MLTWKSGARGKREAYILPILPIESVLPEMEVFGKHNNKLQYAAKISPRTWPMPWDGHRRYLYNLRLGDRVIAIDYANVLVPGLDDKILNGRDDELNESLRLLGYQE